MQPMVLGGVHEPGEDVAVPDLGVRDLEDIKHVEPARPFGQGFQAFRIGKKLSERLFLILPDGIVFQSHRSTSREKGRVRILS